MLVKILIFASLGLKIMFIFFRQRVTTVTQVLAEKSGQELDRV